LAIRQRRFQANTLQINTITLSFDSTYSFDKASLTNSGIYRRYKTNANDKALLTTARIFSYPTVTKIIRTHDSHSGFYFGQRTADNGQRYSFVLCYCYVTGKGSFQTADGKVKKREGSRRVL